MILPGLDSNFLFEQETDNSTAENTEPRNTQTTEKELDL